MHEMGCCISSLKNYKELLLEDNLTNLKYLHATLAFYLHDTLSPTANIGRYEQRILVIGRYHCMSYLLGVEIVYIQKLDLY